MSLVSIEGKYEILGKLREGGMGAVYKVRHRLLDEIRVIKVIRPQLVATPELSDRFLREARLAIQLRHPNIAQLHDFSVDEEGGAFIVLEFIDGATLDDLLKATGPPPLGLGLDIAQQALRALGYLHRKGFVHRDIAPDNLMLTRDVDGRPLVKLIDLGIAKVLAGGGGLTVAGMFLGKPRYASPEQFGIEGEAGMDARSDLYSLGVVLYELLTGTHPIPGRDPSSLMAGHLFRPPVDFAVSDPEGRLPPDLREILSCALAKKPEERFATAEEISQQLAAVQARFPVAAADFERVLLLASRESPEERAGRPGSTQDRLDRRFAKEATPAAPVNLEATQVLKPAVLVPPVERPPAAPPASLPSRTPAVDLDETGLLRQRREFQGEPEEGRLTPVPSPIALPTPGRGAPPPTSAVARAPSRERREAPWMMLGAGLVAAVLVAGLVWWFLGSEPEASPGPVVSETPLSASSTASVEVPPPEPSPVPVTQEAAQETVQETVQETAAAPAPESIQEPVPVPVAPAARPDPPKPRPTPAPAAAAPERTPTPRPAAKERKPVAVQVDSSERKGRRSSEDDTEVVDARVISSPAPVYPEAVRASGAYAMISVGVLVDETGAVVDAKIKGAFVDGGPGADFRKAALEAARKARFDPATRNGVPCKMWGELTYEFGTKKP